MSPATATTPRSPTRTPRSRRTTAAASGSRSRTRNCPDGRPLLTTPIYDRLTEANAVWGATFGLEHALWFQEAGKAPKEEVTFRRSNAWSQVAAEVEAVRERVGMTEISNYAKYRVTGPGAEAWLSSLLTARMPAPGRITLTAMLNEAGRIVGEFTVARASDADEFYLFGSLPAEVHHSRWFRHHLPGDGSVRFEVLGLGLVGLSVAGPRSRDVLSAVAPDLDLSTEAFPFMTFRNVDLGMIPAHLARINYAGDLGYELWVEPQYQRVLFDRIVAAGEAHGLRLFGMRALMSLRLEKSYGTWFREYRPIYTPLEAGITRYIKLDHDFIGREALRTRAGRGRPGPDARRDGRRARSRRPGRCHRRRTHLASRRGRRLGDVRRVRPSRRARRSRWGTCRRRWRRRMGRAATASKSRSSGDGDRPGSSRDRASTRTAPGCERDGW